MLAHYSMSMIPVFLNEGCLAIFIKNEVLTDDYTDGKAVAMKPLKEIIILYEELFRNEHYVKFNMDKSSMLSRVDYFSKKGYLKV